MEYNFLSSRMIDRVAILFLLAFMAISDFAIAQQRDAPKQELASPKLGSAELAELQQASTGPQASVPVAPSMDLLQLLVKGGVFMIPIAVVSLLAAAFAIERLIGLRSGRLLPNGLAKQMQTLVREEESIDPRIAYPICLQYPSAASNVLKAVLLRAGRPMSELNAEAVEVSQREADKAHAGVRWLNLAAGLAPLLGLIGTVWGLIQAFHDMTLLTPSQNRADFLGRGIYIALVTTLAGLTVAIPATFIGHWFEGRILRYFNRIQEMVDAIIPKLERYEGKLRFEAIGSEVIAKHVDANKKVTASVTEPTRPIAVPPVQTVTFSSMPSQTNQPTRKPVPKS